jgi:Zn-dependent peptidase ImmA (M78 family)
VLRDILAIERVKWDLIVLDEGQRIKNWEAKTSQTLKSLRSPFALVLSGTPLENRLDDLYSVVEFIDDRRLGPAFRFFNRHRVTDARGKVLGYKNLDALRENLKPVLLRRTRAAVLNDLPPRTTEIVRIPPTAEQSDIDAAQMRVVSSIVRKAYISEMDLLRLQKALLLARMNANSTFLVDKRPPGYSSKLERLTELLEQLAQETARKIVLFSEWTTMLGLVEAELEKLDLGYVRLDGAVPQKQRQQLVNRFQRDPACRLFITTNAGATGLNLQAANTVINVDLPWNPAAIAKALRVPEAHFTEDAPLELKGVEYRASSRMTPVSKRLIHDDIRRQLGLRGELEALVPAIRGEAFKLPRLPGRIGTMDAIDEVAQTLRDAWGLGVQPIANLTNLLEAHGVKVVHVTIRDGWFDGLACRVDEAPVVVVGADWPGDRQRFTLAHELGHLVLAGRLPAALDEERACHRFAGAFIAPSTAVKQLYIGARVAPMELWLLKHEWGLSMGAWIYRLEDTHQIDAATARALWREFRAKGWNKAEPGPGLPRETATVWQRAVCALVGNGRISEAKAAELLGVDEGQVAALLGMG